MHAPTDPDDDTFTLHDLRVTVERIEGRSVCGMREGDWFELRGSNELTIAPGRHFCIYALQAALPLLPAMQRDADPADWISHDSLVCCPDPDERLIMRIQRVGRSELRRSELT